MTSRAAFMESKEALILTLMCDIVMGKLNELLTVKSQVSAKEGYFQVN